MDVITSSQNRQSNLPWPRVKLKEVATFSSGSRNTNTAVDSGEFPFFVCSSEVLQCDEFDFETDAVIMAGNNADGIFHLHHFAGKFAARQRTYVISPRSNLLESRWLYCQLERLQPIFQASAIGTTTRYVTIGMLREAEISLPARTEQRAIAAALSDVDALLSKLDQLIAKKRDLKQAAMQQLLTGKTRLPGFSGEWKIRRLGEIGEVSGAGVDKTINPGEMPVRLLNYLDVYKKNFLQSAEFSHEVTAKPDQVRRCAVQRGDIFFTPSSEVRDDIGHSAIALEDMPDVVYSYHVVRLRLVEDWDVLFRAYAFKSKYFMDQASTQCEGSGTRYVITLPKFRAITVRFPTDVAEQNAIATILFEMDSELTTLEVRREKLQALKQGMMQELLTGRIRLI